MAVEFTFNGKLVKIPGTYAATKALVNNQPLDLSYGNVLIIDKNGSNQFGGGSSIAGQNKEGAASIEAFDNLNDFRSFVRGGDLWDIALPLFKPYPGTPGISKLIYARALETIPSQLTVTWTGGGPNGGNLVFKSKHEGLTGNGYEINATAAYQTVEVVQEGALGDVMIITANGTELGTYDFTGTETPTDVATAYAAIINGGTGSHGYTATASTSFITIYAPEGSGSAANAYTITDNSGMTEIAIGGNTMSGGVTEQRATAAFTVTSAGTAGDTLAILAGVTSLGNVVSAGTTTAILAAAIASAINTNTGTTGYSATIPSGSSTVTILAPVGDGASANGIIASDNVTGSVTVTFAPSTFAGGVDAVAATQELDVITTGDVGSILDCVVNGVLLGSYTVGGADTPSTIETGLAAAINANTGTTQYSAAIVSGVVVVTAPIALGGLPNTYVFASSGQSGQMDLVLGGATFTGGLDGNKLTRGICMTMEQGLINPAKFRVKFWRGTFTGLDSNNQAYDGTAEIDTVPQTIATSPEFDNIQTLITWCTTNSDFNNNIKLVSSVVSGTGQVTSNDLINTIGNKLFLGGTQTYSTLRVTEILDAVKTMDYTHILSTDGRGNYSSVDNGKLQYHIEQEAKYEKFLWVPGGQNKDEFSLSLDAAAFFNFKRTQVVHGGCLVPQIQQAGLREKSSLYKTAAALGRTCGLAPQTPLTFKALDYAGEVHSLIESEIIQCIDGGVCYTNFDSELGFHVVGYGINTLQQNQFIINDDASSYLISLNRISAQLNKELQVNAKIQLFGNQSQGPNVGTLSKEIVRNWVSKFLKRKTVTTTTDNLIISYQDIIVEQVQDAYQIGYSYKANLEINKLFITGTILDPNS